MVHAVDHKEGQRRLDWEGAPASWLPDSEEPHLPSSDAQKAKGDGASSHSKPPKQGGESICRVNVLDQRLFSQQQHEPKQEEARQQPGTGVTEAGWSAS